MTWNLATIALGLLCTYSSGARADSPDALYKRGVELRKAGKDAEALQVFQQLRALEKSGRALAQTGLAEQALGIWVDAEDHIEAALRARDDAWIKKNRETLNHSLGEIRARLGTIEVWGEPAGAEVLVDGRRAGVLPLPAPVRVVVGDIPITVRAPGYLDRSTVVTVAPNDSARERFVLQRDERGLRADSAAATLGPAAATTGSWDAGRPGAMATLSSPAATPPPAGPGSARRAAKWVAWGAGAAALGVGVFGALRQSSAGNQFDTSCGLDAAGLPQARDGSGQSSGACADLKTRVDSSFRIEVIGMATAAALGGTGLLLWLTEPSSRSGERTALSCAPALTRLQSVSVGCTLRF